MNILTLWSVMLGVIASVVPNLVFRGLVFRNVARTPKQVVRSFYVGEALKIVSLVALFCVILNYTTISSTMFFLAFLSSEIGRWLLNCYRLIKGR